ncbi:9860_t:CDS:2, partial [Dentiscutata erythropus]
VINNREMTINASIGVTAAHCLYDNQYWYTKMFFCAGFNDGNCVKNVAILKAAVVMRDDKYYYDYGLIKFDNSSNLQNKIGYLDWDNNPGNNVEVTIFGYSMNSELQCAKNGNVLCMWHGISTQIGSFRHVPVDTGSGSSGGPWIKLFDSKKKQGWLVGSVSSSGPGS